MDMISYSKMRDPQSLIQKSYGFGSSGPSHRVLSSGLIKTKGGKNGI